jgi:hypothetical protein
MIDLFTEIECCQEKKHGENICGDAFAYCKEEDGRVLTVLSDGLGSGVKANILASMTASMALKFARSDGAFMHSAQIMMDALPVCRVRKIGYATYTIVDFRPNGRVRVIEQGNPPFILLRGEEVVELEGHLHCSSTWEHRTLKVYDFQCEPEDRIVFFSDGITEAGLGTKAYALGWRRSGCAQWLVGRVAQERTVSARRLAGDIIEQARLREPAGKPGDDMSCSVIYLRRPRRLLVLSGPPFDRGRDAEYGRMVREAPGQTVVCGGTSAEIVGRQLGVRIFTDLKSAGHGLPPVSRMDGVDLVTEGILTLTRTLKLLEGQPDESCRTGAYQVLEMLRESDMIDFVIGTRINEAHQDPNLPVELDIRRNLVRQIARVLREKYLKEVNVRYI